MENQKQLGGKRRGAGRKPILHKKKQVSLYVEGGKMVVFGGEEKMKTFLYETIDGQQPQMGIQDLTKPTHMVKPIEAMKVETNSAVFIPEKQFISPYNAFRERLKKAATIPEIEEIMREVRGEAMIPREKNELEAYAKELSKEMFND